MSVAEPSFFLPLLIALGLASPPAPEAQGYIEAEYVLSAPQIPGRLEELRVARGASVKKGETLFILEHESEKLAVEKAEAQAAQSAAQLADLLKGKRQPELDALIAQRDQAAAAFQLAKINVERDAKLEKTKGVSQADVDTHRAAMDQAKARLEETEASLAVGRQSVGRDDAISAAQEALNAANAARAQAQWQLDQKTVVAPADAFVFDTLYRPGEPIAAGQGVVSLLPPENIKVRFFVTEPLLQSLKPHQPVRIEGAEGRPAIPAHITYISPQAEYTPPELFNRDNRAKLLYMIEATPDEKPTLLHPGEPVDVRLSGEGRS